MNQAIKKRDISIDIAKGIGILTVILGHCGVGMASVFHMPFFLILSGLFLSSKTTFPEFVKSRARRLLVPYLFGVCLTIVGAVLKDLITGADTAQILADIQKWFFAGLYGRGAKGEILIPGVKKIGAFWFLLAIFYGSVIVRKFIDNKYLLAITALIAYVGYATRQIIFLPFSIQNGMVASFFIALGVYCTRYGILKMKPDAFVVWGLVGLSVFAFANNITLSMVNLRFNYGFLNVIVSAAVTYLIVLLSQRIIHFSALLSEFFAYCGKNSLIILCYHAFEINIFRWQWVAVLLGQIGIQNAHIITLAQFFVRVIFCLVCTVITNHIKPLKKIF